MGWGALKSKPPHIPPLQPKRQPPPQSTRQPPRQPPTQKRPPPARLAWKLEGLPLRGCTLTPHLAGSSRNAASARFCELVGSLAGWLVGWLAGWLVTLVGWLVG